MQILHESKYHYQRDCLEWKGLAKEKFQITTKASIVKEMKDIVEQMDAIENICRIEETDFRRENQIKDGIVQIAEEARNCAVLNMGCRGRITTRLRWNGWSRASLDAWDTQQVN